MSVYAIAAFAVLFGPIGLLLIYGAVDWVIRTAVRTEIQRDRDERED